MNIIIGEKPKKRRKKKKLRVFLYGFMRMGVKSAKVEFNDQDYVNSRSAYASLYKAIKRGGYPIDIHMIDYEIWLERRDM